MDQTDACWHVDYCDEDGPIFMGRFDPARVLRDVESKRQLVGLAEFMGQWTDAHDRNVTQHEIGVMRALSGEVLRHLAQPWSEHDDYAALFPPAN
jgi:hypothetical protein